MRFVAALAVLVCACAPCEDIGPTLGDACLPPAMAEGVTLEIEVEEDCGTSCSAPLDCTASVEFQDVTVIATQTECRLDCVPDGTCQRRTTSCLLPALTPGDYQVHLPGLPSRSLRVEPGAPQRCTL